VGLEIPGSLRGDPVTGGAVVDHGVEVVETIDPLRWCDDTEILAEEPEGSGEPGGLGSQIRRLQVLAVASELLEARKLRDSTASSVEAVDSPLLRARWELAAGRLAEAAYEPDEARAHLDRALTLALEHGPPRIALQAAIGLVRVLEPDPERVHEAGWLARVALGLARRIDAGGPAEAAVLVEQAKVASAEGQSDEALASLQSALDMVRGRPIGRYGEAQVTGELAVVSARSGDAEAARRRLKDARVLFDERWGRRHPRFGQLLVRLGEGLRLGGHPREALTLLEEARRLFDDAGWGDTVDAARAWLEVGRARAEAGHVDAAIFEIAAAKLDAALGETHPATLDAVAERAHWARRSGDLGGAAVLYVQLLGDVEARYTKVHPRYVAVLLELASTRREQGQPEESIELLRRARDLVGDVRAPVELQLRIALSLTELNADRDPTEAERYLEEARALADDDIDAALLARLTASEEKLSTKSRTRR
jgi:tetratricopeptide (TPR) repeat protein